jgi:hypothetical protein
MPERLPLRSNAGLEAGPPEFLGIVERTSAKTSGGEVRQDAGRGLKATN